MYDYHFSIPKPKNEPANSYGPGTLERALLKEEIKRQTSQKITIPLIIGGKEVYTEKRIPVTMPHNYRH